VKPQRTVTAVAATVLILCLAGAVVTLRQIDSLRQGATLEEVLYIPSPRVLQRMSLGYSGLLADIYWTRAVQYFGRHHKALARRYDLLYPLLDIATTLDPHLVIAYKFGSIFLAQPPPQGAGLPDKAVELVERGIRDNPQDWELYFHLGFIHYMERHDYAAAVDAFRRGARVPGAHPHLGVLAAAMSERAGDVSTARLLWSFIYQTTKDTMIKENAWQHLVALQMQDDRLTLGTAGRSRSHSSRRGSHGNK